MQFYYLNGENDWMNGARSVTNEMQERYDGVGQWNDRIGRAPLPSFGGQGMRESLN